MGPATARSCRACGAALERVVADLGAQPPCQRPLEPEALDRPEAFHPLRVYVCEACLLVQLGHALDPRELFAGYGVLSAGSETWRAHADAYVDMAVRRFGLGPRSRVVEVGSNDGYLLRGFVRREIPSMGVDPAEDVAEVARRSGVPTTSRFFGAAAARELRAEFGPVDLVVANNVLNRAADLHDFVEGLWALLAPHGTITLELPHLLRLLEDNQLDALHHEHVSYLSLEVAARLLREHGLEPFDVEELSTHGGSLRVYARHLEHHALPASPAVDELLERERAAGLRDLARYDAFEGQVRATKRDLLQFLIGAREEGRRVVGWGAGGRAATLLNYCGVRTDLLEFTVAPAEHEQGRHLPGSRVPILHPDRIAATKPDFVLILSWTLRDEVARSLAGIQGWRGKLAVAIPRVEVFYPPMASLSRAA